MAPLRAAIIGPRGSAMKARQLRQERIKHIAMLSVLACLLALPASARADFTPIGPELHVTDSGGGTWAHAGSLPDGTTLLAWHALDGSVRGRIFDPVDGFTTGEFEIVPAPSSTSFTDSLAAGVVAALTDETFVLVWQEGATSYSSALYGQKIDSSGALIGVPFEVNSYPDESALPRIAALAGGGFVVVWTGTTAHDPQGVAARVFDSAGTPQGPDFAINYYTGFFQGPSDVAADPAGGFIVTWGSQSSIALPEQIRARQFDPTGTPVGSDILVEDTDGGYHSPRVVMRSDGEVLISWERFATGELRAQFFSADLAPLGSQLVLVGPPDTPYPQAEEVALATDGQRIVAAWTEGQEEADGSRTSVLAGAVDADGQSIDAVQRLVTARVGVQERSAVTSTGAGVFLATWIHRHASGSNPAVRAQQFCDPQIASCDPCPGFDDSTDMDSDGVPDGCDACVLVGTTSIEKPRINLREKNDETRPSKLTISGTLVLDLTLPDFASLSPELDGVSLSLASSVSGQVVDEILSPGAFDSLTKQGWKISSAGNVWKYRKSYLDGPVRNVLVDRFTLKDRSTVGGPNRMSFRAKGRPQRIDFALLEEDLPLQAIIVFGGQPASTAGRCAETSFVASQCSFSAVPEVARCR